jgi:alkylation response protein AidB-like acyl-CoA dehydrogenase
MRRRKDRMMSGPIDAGPAPRVKSAAPLMPGPWPINRAHVITSDAEANVLTTEVAILATNKPFELGGIRSTLAAYDLDRYRRNARTHTLHDPLRWKLLHVGNHHLNGVKPPRHLWL